jgi:NAD-dependent dihydropyrimidine dehydrogenase PreA subunit
MSEIEIVIDQELCDGDGQCVENCPNEALGMKDGKAYVIDPELCGECYYCESICPNSAIRVQRKD